jgi:hypothetical protein
MDTTLTCPRTQQGHYLTALFSARPRRCLSTFLGKGTTIEWLDRLAERARLDETVSTTKELNQVVADWRSNPKNSQPTPAQLLEKLNSHGPYLVPDVRTYSMIVDTAIKRAKNPSEGPRFAEVVLDRMNKEAKTKPAVSPDSVMYSTVINAWAKSGLRDAPYRAETLLQKMQDLNDCIATYCYTDTRTHSSTHRLSARCPHRLSARHLLTWFVMYRKCSYCLLQTVICSALL